MSRSGIDGNDLTDVAIAVAGIRATRLADKAAIDADATAEAAQAAFDAVEWPMRMSSSHARVWQMSGAAKRFRSCLKAAPSPVL